MGSASKLTDEQIEVVEQAADTRVLVTAGPGTGKTFSLIRRLEFLVEDDGLEADEVVVLSFSRAAVCEIRSRLMAHGSAAQHVTVRTFDSFATQLLAETDPDGPWQNRSYDGRIAGGIRSVRENGDAKRIVAVIRHLVVDEVQDLVGVRADLVKVLLESITGGFTLLGDPAQGIYGFQLADSEERVRGSAALYDWVRRTFTDELMERTLTTNFRARDTSVQPSPEHGKALQDVEADYTAIQYQLRTRLMQGNPLGTLQDAVPLLSEMSGSTAVLCRTNGQALLICRELHRLGVPHRLQRSAHDRVLPPWLGELFLLRRSESRASQDDLRAVLSRYDFAGDEAWTLLKRLDRNRRSPSLNLADVRDRLRAGNVPDELTWSSACNLVVSTIHRAKGLEFDHVVVVDPGEPGDDRVDQAESARTLYVAMTRPRDVLMHVAAVDRFRWKCLRKFRNDRWAECGFGTRQHARFGMELRADDIGKEEPAGTTVFDDPPSDLQGYLASQVHPGHVVSLVRASEGGPGTPPRYIVEHKGTRIGVTSDAFEYAMRDVMPAGRNRNGWPESIEDLYVDCVEAVCGSEAAGRNGGLGWSGVWLRPRIVGLGKLNWGTRERR